MLMPIGDAKAAARSGTSLDGKRGFPEPTNGVNTDELTRELEDPIAAWHGDHDARGGGAEGERGQPSGGVRRR